MTACVAWQVVAWMAWCPDQYAALLSCPTGPSLNILIKLMAVESLVFAPFFANIAGGEGLIFQFFSGN